MSTLWGPGMILVMFSAWSFAKFANMNDKRDLITGIVALILAIALPLSGFAIFKNCNGCGCEYFKHDMPDYCEKCGHALTEDAAKKFECGCGAVYYSDGGEKFCTECGTEITYSNSELERN